MSATPFHCRHKELCSVRNIQSDPATWCAVSLSPELIILPDTPCAACIAGTEFLHSPALTYPLNKSHSQTVLHFSLSTSCVSKNWADMDPAHNPTSLRGIEKDQVQKSMTSPHHVSWSVTAANPHASTACRASPSCTSTHSGPFARCGFHGALGVGFGMLQ